MNKRIQELAEQCTTIYNSTTFPVDKDFDYEKFAELLIRECIDVCANGWQGEFTAAGISQCVSDLREHFGVTE